MAESLLLGDVRIGWASLTPFWTNYVVKSS
jgi:hypothetical protein